MCETKTKKRLFALFVVPLLIIAVLCSTTLSTTLANAATAPTGGGGGQSCANWPGGDPQIIYYYNSDKTQVKQETYGTNADGSDCKIYPITYQKLLGGGIFREGGTTNTCGNEVQAIAEPGATSVSGNFITQSKPAGSTLCSQTGTSAITIYKDEASAISVAKTAGQTTGGGGGSGDTSCAIPGGFGWALCPIATLFASVTDGLYDWISNLFLSTSPDIVSTSSGTYSAWQAVLVTANIVFVIIFLIIIFSQATGYGLSNYGIKKMLPKLIVGAILINLSFFLCQLAVDASNLLGYGITGFMKSFGSNTITWSTIMKDILVTQFTAVAGAAAVITPIIALNMGLGIGAVLLCVITLLFIVLFLIARQVLIIMCVVLAPIAFAAWLLPNTEKFFKRWWKIFYAMLIVFPLASLVVGSADLASTVISNAWFPATTNVTSKKN